ncbi:MAG TPA: NYN domain-containing protein [Abditibacterium sp.]
MPHNQTTHQPFEQRVGVFIDVQNMFYAAKHLYGSKLDFTRLLPYVSRQRPLTRAISYIVRTPEIDQSNFITMLRSNGYEIRVKDLKMRPDGSAKGDWDMGLALDALAMVDRLDVVAIVSGDGDFVELVNFLKARGVRVEVYSFPHSTAEELRLAATEYYQMGPEVVMPPHRPLLRSLSANEGEIDSDDFESEPDFLIEPVIQAK